MRPLDAALALVLCVAGCADAHAQPRRDAGPARNRFLQVRAAVLRNPFHFDGGVPPALFTAPSHGSDLDDILTGAATTRAAPPPRATDAQVSGTIGAPARQGRFGAPERLVGVSPRDAHIWLTVAEGWVLRCLERLPRATPFDAPVRLTVALDGSVAGVAAEGVSEASRRCLVEGLGHARFRPVPRGGEVVARYRFTVRGRPSPGIDAGSTSSPSGASTRSHPAEP